MNQQRNGVLWPDYRRSLLAGCGGAFLLLLLLFLLALLSEKNLYLLKHSLAAARVCLAGAAIVGGLLAAGRTQHHRLALALAGESVILAVLIAAGLVFGFRGGWTAVLIDVGIVLIGAFAGGFAQPRGGQKQRGKRHYRT